MPYLNNFRLKLEKIIVIFEISTLEFAKMEKFVQIKKFQIWNQKCHI